MPPVRTLLPFQRLRRGRVFEFAFGDVRAIGVDHRVERGLRPLDGRRRLDEELRFFTDFRARQGRVRTRRRQQRGSSV